MSATGSEVVSVFTGLEPSFRAVATAVVPEAESLDATGWAAVESIVERALEDRPAKMRRQLRLFLRVIDFLPVPRTGRRFRALDPAGRREVLERLERSRLLLLRRGFWGLRTLVFMGYYARPEAASAIGYSASPRGWEARREGLPPARGGAEPGGGAG